MHQSLACLQMVGKNQAGKPWRAPASCAEIFGPSPGISRLDQPASSAAGAFLAEESPFVSLM